LTHFQLVKVVEDGEESNRDRK